MPPPTRKARARSGVPRGSRAQEGGRRPSQAPYSQEGSLRAFLAVNGQALASQHPTECCLHHPKHTAPGTGSRAHSPEHPAPGTGSRAHSPEYTAQAQGPGHTAQAGR